MILSQTKTLNFEQVTALPKPVAATPDTNKLLDWAANQEIDFLEDQFLVPGKNIYRFQGSAESGGATFYSFGRSEDRKLAAIKATAEIIERMIFHEFTQKQVGLNLEIEISGGKWTMRPSGNDSSIEKSFHNSNGWAVDFSVENAIDSAVREAVERHLLLLTFAKSGWDGFFQINHTGLDQFEFRSLVSKYSMAGFAAGMAICQSPNFLGASFGYLADNSDQIFTSKKWEQAFYESFDFIRMKEKDPETQIQSDLVGRELDFYLNQPFTFEFSTDVEVEEIKNKALSGLAVIDLKERLGLPVPFFAAVVHGGDLLPLYFNDSLTQQGRHQMQNVFQKWNIGRVPERHPIL